MVTDQPASRTSGRMIIGWVSPNADELEFFVAGGAVCELLPFGAARETLVFAERCPAMIRKLKSGEYRLYSRRADPKTGRRRNLGTFHSRAAAEKHEREVQFFKRRG